jgi:small GTP-binding protein domain
MRILNIGIVAHVDAGKTTLTENILFESGVIRRKGRVDTADTVTDDLDMERKRGITIREKTVSFEWNNVRINLLDTPGHSDFLCEVVRAFQVLDMAVLVISAKEGIQPQTIAIYNLLAKLKIPVMIFINKLDRAGIDIERLRADIGNVLMAKHIALQSFEKAPNDEHVLRNWRDDALCVEENLLALSEFDGDVINQFYLRKCYEEIEAFIYELMLECRIVPVLYGIAMKGIGVKELLDEIAAHCSRKFSNETADLSGIVYKVAFDEKRNSKAYFRLYQGSVSLRGKIRLAGTEDEFQVKGLERICGGKLVATDCIQAGDIGVLTNISMLRTGDIIGEASASIREVPVLRPILAVHIFPANAAQRSKLLDALYEISIEDNCFDYVIESETSNITVHLFGNIQKEFLREQLLNKYGVDTWFSKTVTIFRETPNAPSKAAIGMGQQGNPHNAAIALTITPLPRGEGVRYETNVSFGYLTKSFQNAVRDGILKGLKEGLHGWQMTDILVTFTGAFFDSVSSTPADFRDLAPMVLSLAIKEAGTTLLEPIYCFEAVIPMELCGKITYEIEAMRGSVTSINNSGEYFKLFGKVPSETSQDFPGRFASLTKNKGSFDVVDVEYEGYMKAAVKKPGTDD